MEEYENLYDKIKEILGSDPNELNIIEGKADVNLQNEYFEYSRKISEEYEDDWAINKAENLDNPEYPLDTKKTVLARLASIDNIKAYKYLEAYMQHPDIELKDWGELALQESKMHLQACFLDEAQVFISTGLGGKENKLRYFVVLLGRDRNEFSSFQKDIIKKEFSYIISNYGGDLEDFNSSGYLTNIMLLLPIEHSVRNVFREGIEECNQFGNFLNDECIITNVKRLTFKEVTDFIENNPQ